VLRDDQEAETAQMEAEAELGRLEKAKRAQEITIHTMPDARLFKDV